MRNHHLPMLHAGQDDLRPTDMAIITTGLLRRTHVIVDRVEGNTVHAYPLDSEFHRSDKTLQISASALARC